MGTPSQGAQDLHLGGEGRELPVNDRRALGGEPVTLAAAGGPQWAHGLQAACGARSPSARPWTDPLLHSTLCPAQRASSTHHGRPPPCTCPSSPAPALSPPIQRASPSPPTRTHTGTWNSLRDLPPKERGVAFMNHTCPKMLQSLNRFQSVYTCFISTENTCTAPFGNVGAAGAHPACTA